MAIPALNENGVLPEGIHPATFEELSRRFRFSPKRVSLIEEGLKPLLEELKQMGVQQLCVDGSFITAKFSPDDIDGYVAIFPDSDLFVRLIQRGEFWKAHWNMDIYPALKGLQGEGSEAFFEELFGQAKEDPHLKKGIVRLIVKE